MVWWCFSMVVQSPLLTSLKQTVRTWKWAETQKETILMYSNHPFSGAFAVRFREGKTKKINSKLWIYEPCDSPCWTTYYIPVHPNSNTQNGAQGTLNVYPNTRNSEVLGKPLIDLLRRRFSYGKPFHTDPHHDMTGEVFLDVYKMGLYQLVIYKWSYNSIGWNHPSFHPSLPMVFSAIYKGAHNWSLHEKTPGNGTSETKAIPKAIPTRFRTSDPKDHGSPSDSGGRPGFP